MPRKEINYQNTLIYKIQHIEKEDLIYIGHTTDFTKRKCSHKHMCNNVNSKLSGLTMVISGFRNAELQEKLEDMGVRFTTSVSKNTDYVIVKDMSIIDEPTGKIKKAIDIGVKVITVDMLNKMM